MRGLIVHITVIQIATTREFLGLHFALKYPTPPPLCEGAFLLPDEEWGIQIMNQFTESVALFGALIGGSVAAVDWHHAKGKNWGGREVVLKRVVIGIVIGVIVGALFGILYTAMH